ncbi:hypothetical protein SANTM175S_03966 [Streptomyces antimycoticus]
MVMSVPKDFQAEGELDADDTTAEDDRGDRHLVEDEGVVRAQEMMRLPSISRPWGTSRHGAGREQDVRGCGRSRR